MSNVEIVAVDQWNNRFEDGKVPAGTVWVDGTVDAVLKEGDPHQVLPEGAVPAVWTHA